MIDCVEGFVTLLSLGIVIVIRFLEIFMCGSSSFFVKIIVIRFLAIFVCGSSIFFVKIFVFRFVLKKFGKLFLENGKVRVTFFKVKEFRDVCFRVVREIYVLYWCVGKFLFVCYFLKL